MHIKFLKYGRGSSVKAVRYLMQEFDSNDDTREVVQIMDGTPELFASMCDSLNFSHRYSSAVVRWHPDDYPTPDQFQEVLDDFKRVALGGVNAPFLAVRHDDHLHILIGRVDLDSGKAFNPAPPGWERDFDPLRDYYNAKYDWARPDDPERARVLGVTRENLDRKNAKEQITNWLIALVKQGLVTNREDVLEKLQTLGEITRQGKDYISVKIDGLDKALRLKGAIYDSTFNSLERDVSQEFGGRDRESAEERERRVRELQAEFESRVDRRISYNENRFKKEQPEPNHFNSFGGIISSDVDFRIDFSDAESVRLADDSRSKQTTFSYDAEQSRRADSFDQQISMPYSYPNTYTTAEKSEQVNEQTDTARNPIDAIIATAHRVARATKQLALRAVGWFDEHARRREEATQTISTAGENLDRSCGGIEAELERINPLIADRKRQATRSSPSMDM